MSSLLVENKGHRCFNCTERMRVWNIKDKGAESSFKTTIALDIIKLKDSIAKQGLLTWEGGGCCISPINRPAFFPAGKRCNSHCLYRISEIFSILTNNFSARRYRIICLLKYEPLTYGSFTDLHLNKSFFVACYMLRLEKITFSLFLSIFLDKKVFLKYIFDFIFHGTALLMQIDNSDLLFCFDF